MDEFKREKVIVRTSTIGIIANFFLVTFKAFVGFLAGSISIILDAINNFTDALSSIITIVGTKLANRRPTKKHPYGFGRIEYVTSTLIAMLILFAGGMAVYESIKSIIDYFQNGTMPTFEIYSIIIIAAAILVKVFVGLFFRLMGKKADSDALKASGTDALFDAVLSTSTLVGIFIAKYANFYVEGYLGIIIGLFILKSGFGILKESLSLMIGNRYEKEYIKEIKEEILSVEGVQGCYDLILNSYGHNKNIGSVHVGVSDQLSATEIQIIERNIATNIYQKYNTILTVGIYAENYSDERTREVLECIHEIIKKYDNILQIHGFYIDDEKKVINFDLVISFDEKDPHYIINKVREDTQKLYEDYKVIITYDQDFSLS